MNKPASYKVQVTDEYDKFQLLTGNRSIKSSRVSNAIKSIKRYGFKHCPILVNEKFEIIDGQGRFEALKILGLPIEYIVEEGLGVEECNALNANQSNWTSRDYVESYAKQGFASYQLLWELMTEFKHLPVEIIVHSLNDRVLNSGVTPELKGGSYSFEYNDYERAYKELEYVNKFVHITKKKKLNQRCFYSAIQYAYRNPSVDNSRFFTKISENYCDIPGCSILPDILRYFDVIYNKNLARKSIISMEYDYNKELYI